MADLDHVRFRQDVDPSKIIVLDTWVRDLEPNHQYLLQRAVDAANVVDGELYKYKLAYTRQKD